MNPQARRSLVRRLLAVLALALLALAPPAPAAAPERPVRIAIIDTGIDPSHAEFRPAQVVAWWDFTDEALPVDADPDPWRFPPGERRWDPWRAPYDATGHGTAVASLAAGLARGRCDDETEAGDRVSFAPGAPLIVAKVGEGPDGAVGESAGVGALRMGRAIRWAVEQGADVVSISIGAPWPHHLNAEDIRLATEAGALVVVSANYGPLRQWPYPGVTWAGAYGNAPEALVVGVGLRTHGAAVNEGEADPDVISWGDQTCAAQAGGGLEFFTGTSFATPLVSGMAAGAMQAARDARVAMDGEGARALLLSCASNSPTLPYAREGLGYLLEEEWALVRAHAEAGTRCDYAAQGPHATADLAYHGAKKVLAGAYPDVPFPP